MSELQNSDDEYTVQQVTEDLVSSLLAVTEGSQIHVHKHGPTYNTNTTFVEGDVVCSRTDVKDSNVDRLTAFLSKEEQSSGQNSIEAQGDGEVPVLMRKALWSEGDQTHRELGAEEDKTLQRGSVNSRWSCPAPGMPDTSFSKDSHAFKGDGQAGNKTFAEGSNDSKSLQDLTFHVVEGGSGRENTSTPFQSCSSIDHEDLSLAGKFRALALRHPVAKAMSDMTELYNSEEARHGISDFLPLLTMNWRLLQAGEVSIFIEQCIQEEDEIPTVLATVLSTLVPLYNRANMSEHEIDGFVSRVDDVIKLGKQFVFEKNFIHAVISFYTAAKFYRRKDEGNSSIQGITQCIDEMKAAVEKFTKQPRMVIDVDGVKKIVTSHVIPVMTKMSNFIRCLSGPDVIKVEKQACCLSQIAKCYGCCDDYKNQAKTSIKTIEFLKSEQKTKANRYRIYGHCYSIAGEAYLKMHDIEAALKHYKKALRIFEVSVKDWSTDEQKMDYIASTKKILNLYKLSGK